MSEVQPITDGGVQQAIEGQQAPVDPTPGAEGAPDYKAYWEKEKAERIKERNLYRPAQQALSGLDEDSQRAIIALADMARRGDADAIVEWSLSTAQNVSGKDVAEIIAARQNGQQAPSTLTGQQQPPPQPGMTQEQIDALVRQQVESALSVQEQKAAIRSELNSAGYDPMDPAGQTIIRYAASNGLPVKDAIEWFEADLRARAARFQQAAAGAAAQTPTPAPAGTPAATAPAPDMSPKDRAMARVASWNAQ